MTPTREEVIRVARECGLYVGDNLSRVKLVGGSYNMNCDLLIHLNIEDMERFAQHFYEAGAAAAREPLVEALREIDNWLVCACIATPEDMAQSFPHMQQVAHAALAKATGEKT